jgi:hypothetical protein
MMIPTPTKAIAPPRGYPITLPPTSKPEDTFERGYLLSVGYPVTPSLEEGWQCEEMLYLDPVPRAGQGVVGYGSPDG